MLLELVACLCISIRTLVRIRLDEYMASKRTQAAEIANDVEMATDGHNDWNSQEEMNLLPSFKRPDNKASVRDMEMGTRNEGFEEPHVDPHSERRLDEETKLLPSFQLPDKPRLWPPVLAVKAAKTFTKGNRRRQGAPPTNEGYTILDSLHEDQNQESCEQGETQETGGQAGNRVNPRQAEISVSGEQVEIQETLGQVVIEMSGEQAGNQESLGQGVTEGSRELFGKTSRSYIRMMHKELMNQFNSYAVLLVLVAGAVSVAVLQPPGSLNTDGHIWKAALSYLGYLLGAPMSFLTAMMGLMGVMLGFVSLSEPVFYDPPRTSDTLDGSATLIEIEIIDNNITRLNRVGLYLAFSLGSCASAIFSLGLQALKFNRVFIIVAPFELLILYLLEANMPLLSRYYSKRKIKRVNKGPRRST